MFLPMRKKQVNNFIINCLEACGFSVSDDLKQKPPRFRLIFLSFFCLLILGISLYEIFKSGNTLFVFAIHVSGLFVKCTLFWSDAYYVYQKRKKNTDSGTPQVNSPSFIMTIVLIGIFAVIAILVVFHILQHDIENSFRDVACIGTIFNFFVDYLNGIFKIFKAEVKV